MTESANASSKVRATSQERLNRESGARRTLFVTGLATFVSLFGVIASTASPVAPGSPPVPDTAVGANGGGRVVAELPVRSLDGQETVVRIVAPEQPALAPHVRTRATP